MQPTEMISIADKCGGGSQVGIWKWGFQEEIQLTKMNPHEGEARGPNYLLSISAI